MTSPEEHEEDGQWDEGVGRDGEEEEEHIGHEGATRLTPVGRHCGGSVGDTRAPGVVLKARTGLMHGR